jgi:[ribosomal protein S18]-alanine N-acetyltransferase
VKLRDMVRDDMPAVMALEQELFPDDAWTPEMFANEFAESPARRRYLVAEETSAEAPELIGYAGMLFTGGPEADVLTLAVGSRHWGKGTGTALLRALIDEAESRRCTEIFLEVREDNARARELYRRHGFTDIGVRRGYYQPAGVDAIVMRKDLDQ